MPPALTPEACAREIMDTVPRVMQLIRTEMRRHRPHRLSVPQFRALLFLDRHPEASLSALAEHLGVSRPTASVLVDRLVQRGLVARGTDPAERRRAVLRLTTAGRRQLAEARQYTQARLAERLAGLGEAELARLRDGLQLLQRLLGEVSEG